MAIFRPLPHPATGVMRRTSCAMRIHSDAIYLYNKKSVGCVGARSKIVTKFVGGARIRSYILRDADIRRFIPGYAGRTVPI